MKNTRLEDQICFVILGLNKPFKCIIISFRPCWSILNAKLLMFEGSQPYITKQIKISGIKGISF